MENKINKETSKERKKKEREETRERKNKNTVRWKKYLTNVIYGEK